jgi:hypothetical protein
MKYFGDQSGFHSLITCSASIREELSSVSVTNVATLI